MPSASSKMHLLRASALALLIVVSLTSAAPTTKTSSACEYSCGDDECIPSSWICDNVKDCRNGKDEDGCSYLHECRSQEFMCKSGECIPQEKKCDTITDCSDSSDEIDCNKLTFADLPSAEDYEDRLRHVPITTPAPVLADCQRDEFECVSGECIPQSEVCNGVIECSNAADEKGCGQRNITGLPSATDFEDRMAHLNVSTTPETPTEAPHSKSSVFGWIITIFLVLLFVFLVTAFIVIYFRLWPELCDRLDELIGANAHNASNISVGFNSSDRK